MSARSQSPRRPSGPAPDVIVIGGGIVGVSAAAELAATGRRVVLLERTAVAAGASGRNSGVVQHPFDPVLVDLHLETVRMYRTLDEDAGSRKPFALPAEPVGLLLVTHDPAVARRSADDLVEPHPGLAPTYLDPDAVRALEPSVGPGVSACRVAIGYPVGPAAATYAWAARATRLGVDIRIGDAARPWLAAGRVAGVELEGGERISTEQVVVAAGPWTPDVIDPRGRWRPIQSLWGVIVTIDLADPPAHVLEEADIDIEPGTEPDDRVEGESFSLVTAEGASSLGSTFLVVEPDAAALVPSLLARGTSFVPGIATARIGPHRLCARPLSIDGRPLIGAVRGIEGLWVAAGHGPWGISTGPGSGRLLARLIDGRIAAPPPALDPRRFPAPPID